MANDQQQVATAAIGFGANLGDPVQTFAEVCDALQRKAGIEQVTPSPLYRTKPVGDPAAPTYVNAAIAVETTLGCADLHALLMQVEAQLGRVRQAQWTPRTADLDLVLFGDQIVASDALTVPHPRMHYRRFLLQPLSDILPNMIHPPLGLTVADLAARAAERLPQILIVADPSESAWVAEIVSQRPAWDFRRISPAEVSGLRLIGDHLCGVDVGEALADQTWALVASSGRLGMAGSEHADNPFVIPALDCRAVADRDRQWATFLQSLEEPERIE